MKKLIISVSVLLVGLCSLSLSAQEIQYEYSVWSGGGLGALKYNVPSEIGERSGKFGGDFGVGYTFFMLSDRVVESGKLYHLRWGIHTGIGFSFFSARTTIDNNTTFVETSGIKDSEGDDIVLRTTIFGFEETQRTVMLTIPVMGTYHFDRYYANAGFKFGIPVGGNYESSFSSPTQQITNRAYYPRLNNELVGPPFTGLGQQTPGNTDKTDMDFGVSMMFALEAGSKWEINKNLTLYYGIFLDIGLNDISRFDDATPEFIQYNANPTTHMATVSTNSVLSSLKEKTKTMAFGVKVRLGYIR